MNVDRPQTNDASERLASNCDTAHVPLPENTQIDEDMIFAYLEGTLPPDRKLDVERWLLTDPKLHERVQRLKCGITDSLVAETEEKFIKSLRERLVRDSS